MDRNKGALRMWRAVLSVLPLSGIWRVLSEGVRRYGYFFLFSHFIFIPNALAAPAGGQIVGGAGSINQSGLTTTINQNSNSLAINWNSFDVNSNGTVNFNQPGFSSIALNRIMNTIPGVHPLGHALHVQI